MTLAVIQVQIRLHLGALQVRLSQAHLVSPQGRIDIPNPLGTILGPLRHFRPVQVHLGPFKHLRPIQVHLGPFRHFRPIQVHLGPLRHSWPTRHFQRDLYDCMDHLSHLLIYLFLFILLLLSITYLIIYYIFICLFILIYFSLLSITFIH